MPSKSTKEPLLIIDILDGKEFGRRIEKKRTIYKGRDGREWINWMEGKRYITRDESGHAVFRSEAKTITGYSGTEFLKMLKERTEKLGGAVHIYVFSDKEG